MPEFDIINDEDPNDHFVVTAKDANDAAHKALKELGWWVARPEAQPEKPKRK
jgi:hypothetical protein